MGRGQLGHRNWREEDITSEQALHGRDSGKGGPEGWVGFLIAGIKTSEGEMKHEGKDVGVGRKARHVCTDKGQVLRQEYPPSECNEGDIQMYSTQNRERPSKSKMTEHLKSSTLKIKRNDLENLKMPCFTEKNFTESTTDS